jgi:hypothetical protein
VQQTVPPAAYGAPPYAAYQGQFAQPSAVGPAPPGAPQVPAGTGWPQQPPQPPRRRRSGGMIAGVVAGVAAVAAAVVVVVLIGHGHHPKTLNEAGSSSSSSPASSTSPAASSPATSTSPGVTAPAARGQAEAVSSLLAMGNGSADRLTGAVADVKACGNLSSDIQEIQQVENQRQTEYDQAQALQTGSLPNGADLKSDLVSALSYSLQADNDYLTYAQDVQSSGCTSGSQASAIAAGNQAVGYKDSFIGLWNPIATTYQLPLAAQGSI